MDSGKIPVRYARALLLFGKETGTLDKLREDITNISQFFAETPEIKEWLRSPVIRIKEKEKLFKTRFENEVSGFTLNFINLILKNRRENYLHRICKSFDILYKINAGIKTVKITTAMQPDDFTKDKISTIFREKHKVPNELTIDVNPSIIGGFMLQVDDKLYDESVFTELNRLRKELVKH